MQRPNLERMWETFVRIPPLSQTREQSFYLIIRTIRERIRPVISNLQNQRVINWYSFLIHDKNSGVPTSEDDTNAYFHIRVSLEENISGDDLVRVLPDYCLMTRAIECQAVQSIAGIDESLLRDHEVAQAWRIIGEISELVLNILDIHEDGVEIPPPQLGQFLHYLSNMTRLQVA